MLQNFTPLKSKTIAKLFLFSAIGFTVLSITAIGGCKKETAVATCTDGIKNENETGIDCGGVCAACATCSDGIKNGTETGIDCGGTCSVCPPNCSDGIKNGTETGIDCGGTCAPCAGSPVVCFQQSADSGFTNTTISFTNCSSLGTSFLWDFGDGQTSTSFSPSHTYTALGTYTVTLTVTNTIGSNSKTSTVKIYGCDFGYEGPNCTTEIRSKYLGYYNVSEVMNGGTAYTYTGSIATSTSSVVAIIIDRIPNAHGFFNTNIRATVDGNTVTIADQTPDNDAYHITGTGTLSGNVLTLTFTVTGPNGATPPVTVTNAYSSNWTKQ